MVYRGGGRRGKFTAGGWVPGGFQIFAGLSSSDIC